MSETRDDPYVGDMAYEGANFFDIGDRKRMMKLMKATRWLLKSIIYPCICHIFSSITEPETSVQLTQGSQILR